MLRVRVPFSAPKTPCRFLAGSYLYRLFERCFSVFFGLKNLKKTKKTVDKQIGVWYSIKAVRETGRQPECGSIAQLGEHLPYKQGVTGSSPVVPTIRPGSSVG